MSLDSYDISITNTQPVTMTATMCSAPTYTVSSVRIRSQPVFRESANINGVQYSPGQNLITSTGGTVVSTSPFFSYGATTAASVAVTATGTYSSATTAAAFVIPFGSTFNSATKEYDVGGSPREYSYVASFVTTAGGVTATAETIIAGKILVAIENRTRVPVAGPSTYKACSVTQV